MQHDRLTVTLPHDLVEEIDREDEDRGRFVLHAVKQELHRRRQEGLRLSLRNPHAEIEEVAEEGFDEWVANLPKEDVSQMVDLDSGKEVRWLAGEGWVEVE